MSRLKKIVGRIITNSYYEFQTPRISFMNQIRDVIRKRLEGVRFDEVEQKKKEKKRAEKYTDIQLIKRWNEAFNKGLVNSVEHDYMINMWENAKKMKSFENDLKKEMMDYVSSVDVYNEFLSKIRGVAEILSANLIKEFGDCSQYDTVSKLWAHCGLNVVNGKAPKRRKGETINYNPKLKTLTWKISDTLMKLNKGYYRGIYDSEKRKQLNKEYPLGYLEANYNGYKREDTNLSKGHAHNRALRKMRKIFLDHYWHCARELNGLPAEKNYVEGVLGHDHIINWRDAVGREGNGK